MGNEDRPFSVRFPPGMREELQQWADAEGRSLANLIQWILRDALRAHRQESATPGLPAGDLPAPPTV